MDRPNVSWMYLCWWMNDVLKVSQLQFYVTLNIPHRYLRRFVQAATCAAWRHCCTYCRIIGESQILFQFKLTTLSRIDTKFANLIIGVLWQSKSQLIIKTRMNQLNCRQLHCSPNPIWLPCKILIHYTGLYSREEGQSLLPMNIWWVSGREGQSWSRWISWLWTFNRRQG